MSAIADIVVGQWRRYRNHLLLRFAMFPEYLRSTGSIGCLTADQFELLNGLGKLPGATVLQRGTPFLWRHLRRCYFDGARAENSELRASCQDLLVMIFDAFYNELPQDAIITLQFDELTSIVLPSLGVLVPPAVGMVQLRRASPDRIIVKSNSRSDSIDLINIETRFKFPYLDIDSQSRLFLTFHRMLISTRLESEIAHFDSNNPTAIQTRDCIAGALALVDQIDAALSSRLRGLIRFYVALKDPENKFTHNSLTSSSLIGTIFLSASYEMDRLAEAIVHEFYHNELNMIGELQDIWMHKEPAEFFYSPWRNDPRPLSALYHGIYVFFGVIQYYREAEKNPQLLVKHALFRERRNELCYQLRTALAQVREDQLSDVGRQIMASIREGLRQHVEEIGPLSPMLPGRQEQHLQQWREQNSAFTSSVNMSW